MTASNVHVLRWGQERARIGPWRGDHRVAYLTPVPDAPVPSIAFVRRCMTQLSEQGFSRVVTGALAPTEQGAFIDAGFEVTERLHLLGRDLAQLPAPLPSPGASFRRARAGDRQDVLAVDHRAFPPFWQLDDSGLEEALEATPHTRYRVAVSGSIVGYAITGRSGHRGFLQRLAVDPSHHHQGLGRALVLDGLRWLKRWGAERVVVNTQTENAAALGLYEQLGFTREPFGLSVLSVGLDPA